MRRVKMVIAVAGLAFLIAGRAAVAADAPEGVTGASYFLLSPQKLKAQKDLASKGDCKAALRVSHYYSLTQSDYAQALIWLRLAAKCRDADAKAELVYMLLQLPDQNQVSHEIDGLVMGIKRINAPLAKEVESEVHSKRNSP
jgi:hypothetical protein